MEIQQYAIRRQELCRPYMIRFLYPQILEKYKDVENKQLLWELIKMEIRSKTISYSFQNELEELDFKICNSANMVLDSQILGKYESAKTELKKLYDLRENEAIFRSKTKWIEQGEKPTKYFFNLEKRNYARKTLSQVKLDNGEITSHRAKVNKQIETFFREIYTTKLASIPLSEQEKSFTNFTEDLELSKLTNEEQELLEHDLSLEEIKNVLHSFEKNKTPGEDGFTKEIMKRFSICCNKIYLSLTMMFFRKEAFQFPREEE